MSETEMVEANELGFEEEGFLPEGYTPGDDIFNPDSWSGNQEQADETAPDGGDGEQGTQPTESDDQTLTMGNESTESTEPDDGGIEPAGDPDGENQEQDKLPETFKLKYNHEEREVGLEEGKNLMQKGMAYDDLKAKYQKMLRAEQDRQYQSTYDKLIEDGESEIVARHIAAQEVGNGYNPSAPAEETAAPETGGAEPAPEKPLNADGTPDYQTQVRWLKAMNPELKEIPQEVANMVSKQGVPLLSAYQQYQLKAKDQIIADLRKQNATNKQRVQSMERAPVSGVTGGGAVSAPNKKDPFSEGFDSFDEAWKW